MPCHKSFFWLAERIASVCAHIRSMRFIQSTHHPLVEHLEGIVCLTGRTEPMSAGARLSR